MSETLVPVPRDSLPLPLDLVLPRLKILLLNLRKAPPFSDCDPCKLPVADRDRDSGSVVKVPKVPFRSGCPSGGGVNGP